MELRFNTFPFYVSYENNFFLYKDLRAKTQTRGNCFPLFDRQGENVSPCLTRGKHLTQTYYKLCGLIMNEAKHVINLMLI